ncbi:hypothetical protein FRB97_009858, partial [Tulasnella sp. 331]
VFGRLEKEDLWETLHSAGLVCRAWYNPAMDVLWASIELAFLLKVLSPLDTKGGYWMDATCPNLVDLCLGGQGIGTASRTVAAQTIRQLRSLENINLSSYDDDGVSAIVPQMVELPALQSLSLERLVEFSLPWRQPTTRPFLKLKKLLIKWPSDSGAKAFIHNLAVAGSDLREPELGCKHGNKNKNLKELTALAGEHKGLESLVMYNKQYGVPISIDNFEPILRCRSLTDLGLEIGGNVSA